jgi:hypothetical protein
MRDRRIIIAGGGVAALEALLALRELVPDVARLSGFGYVAWCTCQNSDESSQTARKFWLVK